jgi:hypothetical protein
MIQQLNIRFGEYAISLVRALPLIPRHIDQTQDDTVNEIFNYYKDDLPLDRSCWSSPIVLLMPFLINFKEELALSVELDVTLVNNCKLRIFVILGNIVEHANGSNESCW